MEGSSRTFTGVMAGLVTSKTNARFSGDLYRFTFIILSLAGTGSTRLESTRVSPVLVRTTRIWTGRVRSAWIRLGWSRV